MNRSKLKRLLTIGHGLGAIIAVGAVYFAWPSFFTPGGTGSNIVLGVVVAIAIVWMLINNLGPMIDQLLAKGDQRHQLQLRQQSYLLLDDVGRSIKRAGKRLSAADATSLRAAMTALQPDATPLDVAGTEAGLQRLDAAATAAFPPERWQARVRSVAFAVGVAVVLRVFCVAPFQIPSGSMIPTLLIGDHLFVWRASYGLQIPSKHGLGLLSFLSPLLPEKPFYPVRWSEPTAGDVVVFEAPPWVGMNSGEDWIKRVVAGPGQRVMMRDGVVIVDGKSYGQVNAKTGESRVDEAGLPEGAIVTYKDYDDGHNRWYDRQAAHKRESVVRPDGSTKVHDIFNDMPPGIVDWPAGMPGGKPGLDCDGEACTVQPGYVLCMGDNRDNSNDGRRWGAVPIENVKGRAIFVWVSVDGSSSAVKAGRFELPGFRIGRMGNLL